MSTIEFSEAIDWNIQRSIWLNEIPIIKGTFDYYTGERLDFGLPSHTLVELNPTSGVVLSRDRNSPDKIYLPEEYLEPKNRPQVLAIELMIQLLRLRQYNVTHVRNTVFKNFPSPDEYYDPLELIPDNNLQIIIEDFYSRVVSTLAAIYYLQDSGRVKDIGYYTGFLKSNQSYNMPITPAKQLLTTQYLLANCLCSRGYTIIEELMQMTSDEIAEYIDETSDEVMLNLLRIFSENVKLKLGIENVI